MNKTNNRIDFGDIETASIDAGKCLGGWVVHWLMLYCISYSMNLLDEIEPIECIPFIMTTISMSIRVDVYYISRWQEVTTDIIDIEEKVEEDEFDWVVQELSKDNSSIAERWAKALHTTTMVTLNTIEHHRNDADRTLSLCGSIESYLIEYTKKTDYKVVDRDSLRLLHHPVVVLHCDECVYYYVEMMNEVMKKYTTSFVSFELILFCVQYNMDEQKHYNEHGHIEHKLHSFDWDTENILKNIFVL